MFDFIGGYYWEDQNIFQRNKFELNFRIFLNFCLDFVLLSGESVKITILVVESFRIDLKRPLKKMTVICYVAC